MTVFILLTLEIILLIWFLSSFPRVNFGSVCGSVFTILIMLATIFRRPLSEYCKELWQTAGGRIFITALISVVMLGTIYCILLSVLMLKAMYKRPDVPTTVVVLGCRVKKDRPTRMLTRRLDTAFDFLCENPDCFCIVSGGKGDDEYISEAEAMKDYLLKKGIDDERLIEEDMSTSTYENLAFSMEIIKKLGLPQSVTIVSDGFHQYRAMLIAKEQHINSYAVSAHTNPKYVLSYWVREWIAITVMFIKKAVKSLIS